MKEMFKGKVNSPATTLTELIDTKQKNIKVEDTAVFPEGPNLAVIGTDGNAETIKYESINNDILVGCTRGFQGEARIWDKGTPISRNFTEYDLSALQENIIEINNKQLKDFEEDSNHRLVTDVEKQSWNAKPNVDTKTFINGKTGNISKADIVALGIPGQDTIVDISGKADRDDLKAYATKEDLSSIDVTDQLKDYAKTDELEEIIQQKTVTIRNNYQELFNRIGEYPYKVWEFMEHRRPRGFKPLEQLKEDGVYCSNGFEITVKDEQNKVLLSSSNDRVFVLVKTYGKQICQYAFILNQNGVDVVRRNLTHDNTQWEPWEIISYPSSVLQQITSQLQKYETEIPTRTSQLENDTDFKTGAEIGTMMQDKVDKVNGKQLSTNDFTNSHKAKVDSIPENPKYTDTTYSIATTSSSGLMSASDKVKLNNLQDLSVETKEIGVGVDYYKFGKIVLINMLHQIKIDYLLFRNQEIITIPLDFSLHSVDHIIAGIFDTIPYYKGSVALFGRMVNGGFEIKVEAPYNGGDIRHGTEVYVAAQIIGFVK